MDLKYLKKVAQEASTPWCQVSGNIPFYSVVTKPAPSLSKHDETRPTYWRYEDGVFIATFTPETILALIKMVEDKNV